MIEIYLFIHPLCPDSLSSEKRLLQMIQNAPKKVQFKILPLLNLHTFQQFLMKQNTKFLNLYERNQLFDAAYSAALDYKAIQLQGKKKGRLFLLNLQDKVCNEQIPYSKQLVADIIESINGDLDMFESDRQSDVIKQSFETDQAIAKEMSVSKTDSAVFFNYTKNQDYGVLVEDGLTTELLNELLQINDEEPSELTIYKQEQATVKHADLAHCALKLLKN